MSAEQNGPESQDRGKRRRLSRLDRLIAQAIGADRTIGREDDPARTQYPELWRWLATIYVGRDRVKQPATLTLRLGPDGVLVTLTDRDLGCSLDAVAEHLDGALGAVEAALTSPTCPLRIWGKKEPNVRKRGNTKS